jgi:hypothetical protein
LFPRAAWGFLVLLGVALFGFWPSYFALLGGGGLDAASHFHGAAMLTWMGLLIAQSTLVRTGRRALHRRVGKLAWVVGPIALLSMLLLAARHLVAELPQITEMRSYLLFVQLAAFSGFLYTWAAGMIERQRPALHARYMIGTSLTLIDPALARGLMRLWPQYGALSDYAGAIVADGILLALIWRERDQPSGRSAFPRVLAVFLVVQLGQFTIGRGDWWHALAQRLAEWL